MAFDIKDLIYLLNCFTSFFNFGTNRRFLGIILDKYVHYSKEDYDYLSGETFVGSTTTSQIAERTFGLARTPSVNWSCKKIVQYALGTLDEYTTLQLDRYRTLENTDIFDQHRRLAAYIESDGRSENIESDKPKDQYTTYLGNISLKIKTHQGTGIPFQFSWYHRVQGRLLKVPSTIWMGEDQSDFISFRDQSPHKFVYWFDDYIRGPCDAEFEPVSFPCYGRLVILGGARQWITSSITSGQCSATVESISGLVDSEPDCDNMECISIVDPDSFLFLLARLYDNGVFV